MLLVRLELLKSGPDCGIFISRVLKLQDAQRQAIDEHYHVQPPCLFVLDHGELIDHQPLVILWIVKIKHLDLGSGKSPFRMLVLHRHAFHQHAMHKVVICDERRLVWVGELPVRLIDGLEREFWVLAR